jgi:murein DD-endopeptidase MepM/ murein hydrolase activator NlpD
MRSKLDKLKRISHIKILFIPESSGFEFRTFTLTIQKILLVAISYSILAAFFGFLIIGASPIGDSLFYKVSSLTHDEKQQIKELNEKIIFLTKELEGLKSTNERLRYAIILGDSSLKDSLGFHKDSAYTKQKNKIEGNLLAVFRKLFFSNESTQSSSYYFIKPVNGFISRDFNPAKGHNGIDYVVKTGSPVFAAASGYVTFSGYSNKDGYMIMIAHADNFMSIYKHCSVILKKERDAVLQGELIALSGNTGEITTGPHLHFEIWKNGKPIDPKLLIINF